MSAASLQSCTDAGQPSALSALSAPVDYRAQLAGLDLSRLSLAELQQLERDLALLEACAEQEREQQAALDVASKRERWAASFATFCREALGQYFLPESGTCELHEHLFSAAQESVTDGQASRDVTVAPRGHAKSTIVSLGLPLWCGCFPEVAKKRHIWLVAKTATQSQGNLGDVKAEFEGNEEIRAVCGDLVGSPWNDTEIVLANGVCLRAVSTGQKGLRGLKHGPYRPDLMIGDDLEDDEHVASPVQREKAFRWVTRALIPAGTRAGERATDVFIVGTIIHPESLLVQFLEAKRIKGYRTRKFQAINRWPDNLKLWEQWEAIFCDREQEDPEGAARAFYEAHRDEMDAGAHVQWGSYHTLYDLMVQRIELGPAAFDQELQNEPINPEDCAFQEEWFRYWDDHDEEQPATPLVTKICIVDPSMGKKNKARDPSAILILGKDQLGHINVLVGDIDRRHPDQIITDVCDWYESVGFDRLYCETVQFQEYLADNLNKEAKRRGLAIRAEGITSSQDKDLRIATLQPLVKDGTIRFSQRHHVLNTQMRQWPKGHDDGPDALEMGVKRLLKVGGGPARYQSLVKAQGAGFRGVF